MHRDDARCVKQKIYCKKGGVCVVSWISKTVKIRAKKEYNWLTNSAKWLSNQKENICFFNFDKL
jgi:hypothetical protein